MRHPVETLIPEPLPSSPALDPEWMQDGVCRYTDPEVFYPVKGQPSSSPRRICASCPVQQRCLQWALTLGDDYGIWGGRTARERKALARAIRSWAFVAGVPCTATGGIPLAVQRAYAEDRSEVAA